MDKGYIIVFDRYIYSIISRGRIRGLDKNLETCFLDMLPVPDICIYLDICPEDALKRLGDDISYWEAGLDIYKDLDVFQSFLKFQEQTRVELKEMIFLSKKVIILDSLQPLKIKVNKVINLISTEIL